MNTTNLSNQNAYDFDLAAFLLSEIYTHMTDDDKTAWDLREAKYLTGDLAQDGIEVDMDDVYDIIAEFIKQDAEA